MVLTEEEGTILIRESFARSAARPRRCSVDGVAGRARVSCNLHICRDGEELGAEANAGPLSGQYSRQILHRPTNFPQGL